MPDKEGKCPAGTTPRNAGIAGTQCVVDNDPNTPLPAKQTPPPGPIPTKPGDVVNPGPDGKCPPGSVLGGIGDFKDCVVDSDPNTPIPGALQTPPPKAQLPVVPGDPVPVGADGKCPPGSVPKSPNAVGGTLSGCIVDNDPNTPIPGAPKTTDTIGTTTGGKGCVAPLVLNQAADKCITQTEAANQPSQTGQTQTPTTGQTPPNRGGVGSSSTFSTTIVNPAAPPTTTTVTPEVSNCRVDGNANGFQQQFDTAKFSACGLYPTGQTAYSEGFIEGCTQAGNTQQMCTAFMQLNTGAQSTTQTQPQTTTQPTQAIQPTQ
jgi:hypothetical protein